MDWKEHGVKIVHTGELDMNTPQTCGMTRAAAITHARTGAEKLWAGTMVVQPDAKTGPHHHGELETVLYVVKGRVRMRWGDHLELSEEARAGDFIYVPPYVPHQEINVSPNEICEAVVVRSGQEPVVINLDVETPESASAGHPGMPFHPLHSKALQCFSSLPRSPIVVHSASRRLWPPPTSLWTRRRRWRWARSMRSSALFFTPAIFRRAATPRLRPGGPSTKAGEPKSASAACGRHQLYDASGLLGGRRRKQDPRSGCRSDGQRLGDRRSRRRVLRGHPGRAGLQLERCLLGGVRPVITITSGIEYMSAWAAPGPPNRRPR